MRNAVWWAKKNIVDSKARGGVSREGKLVLGGCVGLMSGSRGLLLLDLRLVGVGFGIRGFMCCSLLPLWKMGGLTKPLLKVLVKLAGL